MAVMQEEVKEMMSVRSRVDAVKKELAELQEAEKEALPPLPDPSRDPRLPAGIDVPPSATAGPQLTLPPPRPVAEREISSLGSAQARASGRLCAPMQLGRLLWNSAPPSSDKGAAVR